MNELTPHSPPASERLEEIFSRTLLCFSVGECTKLTGDFAKSPDAKNCQRFPAFLEKRKWARGRGFIPDLAQLELLFWKAQRAPEVESKGFENVAMATEPEWYAARFRFDPAHRLIESDWPLDAVFAEPAGEHSPRPGSTYLIYRKSGGVFVRALKGNEAALIRSLQLGVPLGKVLDRRLGPDFDSMTFCQWIESGLLRSIDWSPV